MITRTGLGFDVHPRAADRPLFLGGVAFPDEPGLAGHSDADVVCHAIADAIFGAAGLGDLGDHFPENDPATEGMSGMVLLRQAVRKAVDAGFSMQSCDATVIAERPVLGDARAQMVVNIAAALGIGHGYVSVKATRPEGLGLTGDGAGCLAIATLRQ